MGLSLRAGKCGLFRAGRWAAVAGLLLALSAPVAAQAQELPSFSTAPPLRPSFAWGAHDYVVRCNQLPVSVQVTLPPGWQARVGEGQLHSASFDTERPMRVGHALLVSFNRSGNRSARSYYHVRCLPSNFPPFNFVRTAPGGPDFLMMQMNHQYAAIFDRNGAPLWWYRASGETINAQLLRDGTVSWDPTNPSGGDLTGIFEVRRLDGTLVRNVKTFGRPITDLHDLQLLPNGNYLIGGQLIKSHVDTSAYGGSPDASIMGFEIQEVTPGGELVWKWDSLHHIGLGQTPARWWSQIRRTGPAL